LQKSFPKLLIVLSERVGGSVSQHKQVLASQAEVLKPELFFLSLSLLLTLEVTKGAFAFLLMICKAEVLADLKSNPWIHSGVEGDTLCTAVGSLLSMASLKTPEPS
jgi:hypothetical protein